MDIEKANHWLTPLTNIGVLIGIVLLVFELNQNSDLMRAEMHAMRAEAKASRQMDQANSGEMVRIMHQAYSAGFPSNEEAIEQLTPLDRYRFLAFASGLTEAVQNWHYQCQQGFLDEELCRSGYEYQARGLLGMARGLDADFTATRPSFIADLRRIAREAGMPVPNEDGSWPD